MKLNNVIIIVIVAIITQLTIFSISSDIYEDWAGYTFPATLALIFKISFELYFRKTGQEKVLKTEYLFVAYFLMSIIFSRIWH